MDDPNFMDAWVTTPIQALEPLITGVWVTFSWKKEGKIEGEDVYVKYVQDVKEKSFVNQISYTLKSPSGRMGELRNEF